MIRSPMLKLALVSSLLSSPTAVLVAQDRPAPPEIPDERVLRASEAANRPFVDPGNGKAKQYAAQTGTTVGEATAEMRKLWALTKFVERLDARDPDLFSFFAMRNGELVVGLTDPDADIASLLPPGLAGLEKVPARYSDRGSTRQIGQLNGQLRSAGLADVSIGLNQETGRVEFLTKTKATELQAAIASGQIVPGGEYDIIDDEITVTATLYGSAAWNVDSSCRRYCNLTTGFSLMSTGSDATRFVSTAAHAENYSARFNTGADSTYSNGGVSLSGRQELFSNRLDIEYAVPSSPSTNPPGPYIWDGTQYVTISGAIYPIANVIWCKFGRVTGPSCGMHDTLTKYSNSNWGPSGVTYLYRVLNDGSGTRFIQEGDSGGPVYRGTYAAGWVHGKDSSNNFYYTSYKGLVDTSAPVDLIVAY